MGLMNGSRSRRGAKSVEIKPTTFVAWLTDMAVSGIARSDAECARLLGVTPNTMLKLKRDGADRRTALACRALLHRMEPYS